MPKITVLPHPEICPKGITISGDRGVSLCTALLKKKVAIDHACEQSCACTTCHVIVRQGFEYLPPANEEEEDLLDQAWGLTSTSRLSCQVLLGTQDLVIEIPRYSLNQVRESE